MQDETLMDAYAADGYTQYDDACKMLWRHKEIIAPVLRYTVEEYEDCDISEIVRYINADSISEDTPLSDIEPLVRGEETEFPSVREKTIYFDKRFLAKNPKLSKNNFLVSLHIDLEFQKSYKPSNPTYPITMRAWYYAARELSSQLGPATGKTNYAKLEKVYSIWICMEDVPRTYQNSMTRYCIAKKDIQGMSKEPSKNYDLMEVVIIRLGEDDVKDTGIFDYLQGVFSSDVSRIDKYIGEDVSEEVREEVKTMSGFGEIIAKRNAARGMAEGMAEGMVQGMAEGKAEGALEKGLRVYQNCIDRGMSKEDALAIAEITEEDLAGAKK